MLQLKYFIMERLKFLCYKLRNLNHRLPILGFFEIIINIYLNKLKYKGYNKGF